MAYIAKYEFPDAAVAQANIDALGVATDEDGNTYPTHNHSIVKLGNIVLTPGEYDQEGNETVAPVLSTKYHVDVLWQISDTYDEEGNLVPATHPGNWGNFAVDIEDNGVHAFMGLDYTKHKFITE